MIEGVVNASYEAIVTLIIRGPAGQTRDIKAVVDTGFNGFLTLPPALVTELGLPFASIGRATLADGSEVTFDVYDVTVLWDGQPRHIEADAVDATSLVGMQLLDHHSLYLEIEDGGSVIIQTRGQQSAQK